MFAVCVAVAAATIEVMCKFRPNTDQQNEHSRNGKLTTVISNVLERSAYLLNRVLERYPSVIGTLYRWNLQAQLIAMVIRIQKR